MYTFVLNARALVAYGIMHFFMYSEPALLLALIVSVLLALANREKTFSQWEVVGRSLPAPLIMAVVETLL